MTPVVARISAGQRRISLKAKSFTLAPLRYIRPRYTALGGHLTLGQRFAVIQSIAKRDDGCLPLVQTSFHTFSHLDARVSGIQFLQHIVIHADGVHQRKRIAIPVPVNGIGQGDLTLRFALGPEVHKDLIFYAAGRVSGQSYLFVRFKGTNPFDQSDGTNGDQIILISIGRIVFL